jgi:amino acid adenylation domain-containing protein
LFKEATARKMLGHLQRVLEEVAREPAQPIWALGLPSPGEQAAQIERFNLQPILSAPFESVLTLVEKCALANPDRIALVCGDEALNYGELHARSNQIARLLQGQDILEGDIVAVYLRDGIELVLALFGILKAGAAYLPLDASQPPERIRDWMEESRAKLLISRGASPFMPGDAFVLDLSVAEYSGFSRDRLPCRAWPEQLFYVIYTSGSTGRPKGAGITHRGFTNLIHWYREALDLGASDRFLKISSLCFDLTQKNIFAPLSEGAEVHLEASEGFQPSLLRERIGRSRITVLNGAPSAFLALLESGNESVTQSLGTLRWVVLGGEKIPMERLYPWLASEGCGAGVINSYGPTECSDVCAAFVLQPKRAYDGDGLPIGRPIPGAQLCVTDWAGQPSAEGAVGELAVGGLGVSWGYVNDAGLTAERFLPHAFLPGERQYLTGDKVRLNSEGELEFLGRSDGQVKIRGFRVELGEVEAALRMHGSLREAQVLAREDLGEGKTLVAYGVFEAGQAVEAPALRAFLLETLPEYMVPAYFVSLKSLPLNANGKVDRKALPKPDLALTSDVFEVPRTPTEQILAGMWGALLGRARVGLNDNFFELGGHSLLATRLISRVRDLPVRTRFEGLTATRMATVFDSARSQGEDRKARSSC